MMANARNKLNIFVRGEEFAGFHYICGEWNNVKHEKANDESNIL